MEMTSVLEIDELLPWAGFEDGSQWIEALLHQVISSDDIKLELDLEELDELYTQVRQYIGCLEEAIDEGIVDETLQDIGIDDNNTQQELQNAWDILNIASNEFQEEVMRRQEILLKVGSGGAC